jgi:hypothetical protein
MKSSIIQIREGTEHCPITVVSTNLKAKDIEWVKHGARQAVDGFTITFKNVAREDAGNYSVSSSVVCHDNKTKPINKHFTLDVICK